jgi:autotransporter-associated beta strand protein
MKIRVFGSACGLFLWLLANCPSTHAQRQMEKLGRGVVAVRSSSTQVYVGWRLLANDPEGVGFNLYRSQGGGAAQKLNAQPITNTTDFVDSTATLTVSNSWFVCPVTNGVELAASAPFGIAANAAIPVDFQGKPAPYLSVPLQPVPGNGFYVHHVWPADFDGDGEYDFALTRLPDGTGTNPDSLVEAYLRDGTFLWRMDMGYNSTNQNSDFPATGVSVGHSDNVTAYDLDGDGKAEVIVRTANGVTVKNAAGVQVASMSAGNDITQYISVIDGMTGVEKARATLPNPVPAAGPLSSHMGIMYGDGVHPSVVSESINRNADGSFNLSITCWDYRNGVLTLRWLWTPPNDGKNYSRAHQIRIADVDHDGKDEFCEIGFVLHDDGDHATPLYSTILQHGDRYHIADLDPDRPGLETYAIQQDNPTLLATALLDASTGKPIKEWYSASVSDVARGNAGDVDANTRGVEVFSTQPGLWSCKGDLVNNSPPYPNFSVWWDADLLREQLDDGKIDKYGTGRLVSPYYMTSPAKSGLPTWRNAQPLYGDLFGDWREEVLFESTDHSSLIIFTPVSQSTTRLVCLAQDPEYRECMTVKGYMQSTWPSYYLGVGMAAQPIPPVSDARLVWRGNAGTNWDVGATANWLTNGLWISNTTAVAYSSGDSVLFDVTGSNSVPINLDGTLTPGAVTVYSPNDYTFNGGSLTGAMKLTKAGAGRLTLNNTNTFTGRTLITEGSFIVNGSLSSSPVTVRGGVWLDGRLGGNGSVGAGVSVETGGGVSPGNGTNAAGTLTIAGGLTLLGRTLNDFDLSDDPSGTTKTNDLLNVTGNLVLQGTNTLVIHPLNGSLSPGTYPLITYTGTLTGGLTNLTVTGIDGVPVELSNPSGAIALTVKSTRAPSSLAWAGSPGNNWDLAVSSNWLNGASQDWFVPQDNVRFDNTGSVSTTVNLTGALNPASVTVDATANYTFSGNGSIIGSCGLTKTNSGKLTILNDNQYTGRTIVNGGTLEVNDLSVAGSPGPLGSAGVSPTNLVFYGSTFRLTGDQIYTDRGMTLASGMTTVEVVTAGYLANIAGQITGSGGLAKTGAGTIILSTNNPFSGGMLIRAGSVQLASENANLNGVGTGTVTLDGGTLKMLDDSASYSTINWNIAVPLGSTGTLNGDSRCDMYGTLTGGGTLTFWIPYVRATLYGNWSTFTGRVNVVTDSDGGDFRINNSSGYAGAAVNLAALVNAYRNGGGSVSIGELSGSFGSILSGTTAWTIGAKNTDATFAGTISGNSIVKSGTGTWTLTGTNSTYSGGTTISIGTLLVNNTRGSGTGTGSVTVNASGTLGGVGVISGAVTVNGTLAPGGNAIGTLTISNNLVVNTSGTLSYALGTSSDKTVVSGNLTLGGTLNISNTTGFAANTYTLTTYGGALTYNGVSIGSAPGGYSYTINTSTVGQVRLVVATATPPTALFSGSPTNGVAPLPVNFTDSSTGTITNRFWNFGDGVTTNTTVTNMNHTYGPGVYPVTLIVSGYAGVSTNSKSAYITVVTAFQQWQMQYFGCTNCPEAAPDADPLGKGMSNTNQFLAGLNPTNSASALRIISTVQQGNDILITWTTAGVRTNLVQLSAGDGTGGYSTNYGDLGLPIIITGTGDTTTNYVDVGGATNSPSRFYRIRLVP